MRNRADLAALLLIFLTMIRIASTWTTFSATEDEPMHIAAGLQLYAQGTYTMQPENPPLPRYVLAFAPWIGGMKFEPELGRVFYSSGSYISNLVLARCGNLFFFLIAALAVWLTARRELNPLGGLVSTLIFVTQPLIAGFFGLATLDGPAVAGVALALLAFSFLLDVAPPPPAAHRETAAILFGIAFGFAILCKFSAIGYVPAACAAIALVKRRPLRLRTVPIIAVTTAIVILIGYRFDPKSFFAGIASLRQMNRGGFPAYALGRISWTGWWWYFPFALALKTTLASLILAFAVRTRTGFAWLAAALAILAVSMTSHLNLGLRYVLPIYVPLSIAAAAAALTMRRWLLIVLLTWHIGASLLTCPDSFVYFNEIAARRPWFYLLDSNLDWGQDALRLARVAREKHIDRIGVSIMGWHDLDALGFPPSYRAERNVPSQGWVAVSEHHLGMFEFKWLRGRHYERIGKSIRLYYIP
jgi:4-amino-4-deoxy-L-arabinose transferase-like glycosyltransferase